MMADLTPQQFAARRRFRRAVEDHTAEARTRWHRMEDHATADQWIVVMLEEVGKLARCVNKLHLAEDRDVRRHWSDEAMHRMISVASVLDRLVAVWGDLVAATGEAASDQPEG